MVNQVKNAKWEKIRAITLSFKSKNKTITTNKRDYKKKKYYSFIKRKKTRVNYLFITVKKNKIKELLKIKR
jgi:hypothetical protein